MSKKSKPEVLPPTRLSVIPDMRGMLEKLVEQKVAELMSKDSSDVFQPYFQSSKVAAEIRRNQTVSEQRKWARYFKKWGCDVCGTKKKGYSELGRCHACYTRTLRRLNEIMAQAARKKGSIQAFVDLPGELAREALKPLSPPLPPERRMDLEWIARQALKPTQKALPARRKR